MAELHQCENEQNGESKLITVGDASFALPRPINCVLVLRPKCAYLPEDVFQTKDIKNVREIVLCSTEMEELPTSFTTNLPNVKSLNLEKNKLRKLPDNLSILVQLEYLNISHNNFCCLTDGISVVDSLKIFNASYNQISELPISVLRLKNLQHINISDNAISRIPNEISGLVNLEVLNVSNNSLLELPDKVSELKKLTCLNASKNSISKLPEQFSVLSNMNTLNLSYNAFREIPDCILAGLQNTISLDLSHNRIQFFDSPPKCITKLVKLDLSYNAFNDIPQWIFGNKCKSLADLNLSNNKTMIGTSQLSVYSNQGDKVGVAATLKCLNASNCCFTSPTLKFLHGLKSLERLTLGSETTYDSKVRSIGNVLFNFPTSILNTCTSLLHLNVNGVGLADLPEDIGSLTPQLQTLDISCNDLHWLPASFCKLSTLTACQLSYCQLAILPDDIGLLVVLKELSLNGNKLQSLPDSFAMLTKLSLLDLYDNLFDEIPDVVLRLTSLEAMDIEFNCFSYTTLSDQLNDEFKSRYKTLKDNIRSLVSSSRVDERKPDQSEEDNRSDELDDVSSDELPMDTGTGWLQDRTSNTTDEEENWDLSDDPDNHFDPHYVKVLPRNPQSKALLVHESILHLPDNFCPADIHSLPIRRRAMWQPTCTSQAELQFEDAEES